MKTYTVKKDQQQMIEITHSGEYVIDLLGEGAQAKIIGSFLAQNKDSVAVSVVIHHKAKNTVANTILKGVARDTSTIKFVGRIIIDEQCGNSNSFLTQRVLLLSDGAHAQVIPELEILTDDVKCSHAASVSQIPEQQLFYLMSRGIDRKQAEDLVSTGFLNE